MVKFLGRLFGTDRAIDNLTDKDNGLLVRMGGWANNLQYTEEEKAKATERVRDWGLAQLEALEPFKVVQRILAFGVTAVWAFAAVNVIAAIWVDSFRSCHLVQVIDGNEISPTCLAVAPRMLEFALSDYVFWPVLAVLSLYFSGGVIPGLFNKGKSQQ